MSYFFDFTTFLEVLVINSQKKQYFKYLEKYFSDLLIYQLFGYNLAKIQLTYHIWSESKYDNYDIPNIPKTDPDSPKRALSDHAMG